MLHGNMSAVTVLDQLPIEPGAAGSRHVEPLLMIVTTCRQQDRGVGAYLAIAIEAHIDGQPTQSVLPRM